MINVESILLKLQSMQLIRLHKITGNWYTAYCPFHSDGNEKKPSFGFLLTDEYRGGQKYPAGFAHCFACSYAGTLENTISKILESKHISQSGLDWLKENIPGFEADAQEDMLIPTNLFSDITNKYAIDYIRSYKNKNVEYVKESELQKYRYTVPYMYERRLTDEIIEKYDVGYDAEWIPPGRKRKVPCITFPVRDISGNVLFLCRRSIQGKLYNYPENVEKPVYGLDMIPKGTKSICICESIINALTAVSYGYNAVALLGTGTPYQMQQLRESSISEYVLCFDGDDAGAKGEKRFKSAMKKNAIIWTVHMPLNKDLNDLNKDEFDKLYSERD